MKKMILCAVLAIVLIPLGMTSTEAAPAKKKAAIKKDKYEPNNSVWKAKELPYSENICLTATLHNRNDMDYYKVKLPEGRNYKIKVMEDESYTTSQGFYGQGTKQDFIKDKYYYVGYLSSSNDRDAIDFIGGGWYYFLFTAYEDDGESGPGRYRVNISIKEK